MRSLALTVGVAVAVLWTLPGTSAPVPQPGMPARGDISAPVHYGDTMLVLVSEKGAAAVTFPKLVNDGGRQGTEYRYRFRPAGGGKEETGDGAVFEVPGNANNPPNRAAARTVIKAGPISLTWSLGGDDRGWVYYAPETVQVLIATAKRHEGRDGKVVDQLEKIDLSRFRK